MRLLLTGATGFVGRSLTPLLLDKHDVTLLLLEEFGGATPLPPPLDRRRAEFQTVYADLRNYRVTVRAVNGARPERVIHLAAVGVTDPFIDPHVAIRHNVTGTINLLRACFEHGYAPEQLIVARTPGERTAMNVYAASKSAAWDFCRMYASTAGWPIAGAMIFQAYGPFQPPIQLVPAALGAALAGQDFPMTTGAQLKDWIYLEDVCLGIAAMLEATLAPGETVELGTGRAASVLDVVNLIFEMTGSSGRPRPGALPGRPGEDRAQVADIERTRQQIVWAEPRTLRHGLAGLIESLPL